MIRRTFVENYCEGGRVAMAEEGREGLVNHFYREHDFQEVARLAMVITGRHPDWVLYGPRFLRSICEHLLAVMLTAQGASQGVAKEVGVMDIVRTVRINALFQRPLKDNLDALADSKSNLARQYAEAVVPYVIKMIVLAQNVVKGECSS
jgi:hypothetical protein